MIKIKKATLIFLIILAVACGAAGLYSLETTGLAAKLGLGGGHVLSDEHLNFFSWDRNHGIIPTAANRGSDTLPERIGFFLWAGSCDKRLPALSYISVAVNIFYY